jgi:Iap family predicted aminopeptidase
MENHMDRTLPSLFERAYQHIHKLSVEIGPRLSATPTNLAAGEYIRKILSDLDYQIEPQPFDAPAWREIGVTLKAEDELLLAAANTFSPSCSLTATMVPACTLAELKAAELFGKIALLYGDLTKSPISPKSWFLLSEWESELIGLLETGQPAAVITVQTRPGDIERVTEDWAFKIPSLVVSAQTARQLLLLPPQTRIQVEIDTVLEPGQTANIVARKKGLGRAGALPERIVVMAHYDTKPDTPGALDNASGVGVLLALAEWFAAQELGCTLELVAFANEESIPIGDEEYLRRGESYFPEITAAINFDGVGQIVAASSITAISCSPEFDAWVREQAQEFPGVVWVEPWPQSNHSTFSWRGVPSLAFSSSGRFHNDHLRSDTIEWISPAKLAEVIDLAAAIITRLQDQPAGWTRAAT